MTYIVGAGEGGCVTEYTGDTGGVVVVRLVYVLAGGRGVGDVGQRKGVEGSLSIHHYILE